jgi:hypothetical protein
MAAGAHSSPAPVARSSGPSPISGPHSAPAAPRKAALPAGATNGTLGALYTSTSIKPASVSTQTCYNASYFYTSYGYRYNYCYPQTQSPSILTLANGHLGLAYSIYTTVGPLCNATGGSTLSSWTSTSVAWAHSVNGSVWSAPTIFGSPSCRWPSSAEPSFAAGTGGSVDGVYVLSNQTMNSTPPSGNQPFFPADWNMPYGDALAFVHSGNNGTSWGGISEIPNITSAVRPQIAVYGHTVYVVYINTNNSSAIYPGGDYKGTFSALAVEMVVSINNGVTWGSPVVLPGLNASMGNWSSSPSLAVNATGAVSVAYTTDRMCVQTCFYLYGANFEDDVVVSTSTTNGTTWSAPSVVGVSGETYQPTFYDDDYSYFYEYPWMASPQTSIAYASNGTSIYVAYAGSIFKSAIYTYTNWEYSGVFASYSSNGGLSWVNSTIAANPSYSSDDSWYSPAIAVSAGTAYVAYVWLNESFCYTSTCGEFDQTASSWVASSTNGVNWSSSTSAVSHLLDYFEIEAGFQGWESSVTIAPSGHPVTATTLPARYEFDYVGFINGNYTYDYTYIANVSIGYVYTGATTYVNFVENNLTAGTEWGVSVAGYVFTTNQSTINITNVPLNFALSLVVLPESGGYRTIYEPSLSVPSPSEFTGPSTVDVNFTIEYGLQIWLEPGIVPDLDVELEYGNTYQYYEEYYDTFSAQEYNYSSGPFPWYAPGNTTVQVYSYGEPSVTYWNGTGSGSYTGGGQELNLTMTGPVNETAWAGTYGTYTESFSAIGLPLTSTYSFTLGGMNYTSPAGSDTNITDVGTGAYTVTNITATSSTSGWEYFGWIPGGSDVVVVPDQPNVGFDFSLINVASPVGTVTFHATGFGNGTVWSVEFNGTYYSASTPWLNVSTRPGTFDWAVGDAVASNASVGYAPVGTGGTVSVTTGQTVNIAYRSAYRVDVVAGLGGTVSGGGNHWLASGTADSFVAAASTNYAFAGWTGTGSGSYTGTNPAANITANGSITETASFYPLPSARFNVTFQESGIVSGAWWTVTLNGVGYSSNSTSLTVSDLLSCGAGTLGQYHETVGVAYDNATGTTRYYTLDAPAEFCTNGGLVQSLTFLSEYQVAVSATAGGSAHVADGNTVSNSSLWANITDTVLLTATPSVGYTFGGWNGTGPGSYNGSSTTPTVSPGGAVTEFATFVPVHPTPHPKYNETFEASVAFPAGTAWSVTINGTSYAAIGSTVIVKDLTPGQYTATVTTATSTDGLTKWAPVSPAVSVAVTGNGITPVPFAKPSFWVSIGSSTGGTTSPPSGWFAAGTAVTLNASANLGEMFVNWTGTGSGSYSGNESTAPVTVNAPLTEVATFAPVPIAVTAVTSVWSAGTTWIALGVVGLLVGLGVGLVVRRLRTAPASGPEPVRPWTGEAGASTAEPGAPNSGGSP